MPFDWSRYLTLAEELVRRGNDDACLRSGISRAYYAVFGRARELLRDEGVELPGREVHSAVWLTYLGAPYRQRRNIGIIGDRLRRLRMRADYEATFIDLPALAPRAVVDAGTLLRQLDALERP
jgi:hypothetical protein